jgi:hypothetical protein
VVANWPTGEQVSSTDSPRPDRRPPRALRRPRSGDGGRRAYEIAPGGDPRRLARDVFAPGFAGDRVLFYRGGGIRVLDPGAAPRVFGIPTAQLERFVADERNVLWSANGCLLVAPITNARASEPGPGPCERSEFALPAQSLIKGQTVPVRLRCVAASPSGCRGTLRLLVQNHVASSARTLLIPAGQSRTVRVRLTRTGLARIERAGIASVEVALPDGRRQRGLPDLYPRD